MEFYWMMLVVSRSCMEGHTIRKNMTVWAMLQFLCRQYLDRLQRLAIRCEQLQLPTTGDCLSIPFLGLAFEAAMPATNRLVRLLRTNLEIRLKIKTPQGGGAVYSPILACRYVNYGSRWIPDDAYLSSAMNESIRWGWLLWRQAWIHGHALTLHQWFANMLL